MAPREAASGNRRWPNTALGSLHLAGLRRGLASAEQRRIVSKACRDTTGPGHGVYNGTTKRSALRLHSLALCDSEVS